MLNLLLPSINYLGKNAIESIEKNIMDSGFKKALIITDSFMVNTDTYKRVIAILSKTYVQYKTFDQTIPNPSFLCVEKAYRLIEQDVCDFVISIGGGSAHDLAKAVGVKATSGGDLRQYAGVEQIPNQMLPLISINTTSGTGSEVTKFTIITDTKRHVKVAIIDSKVIPWISVNDTDSLISMPKSLTGATGMDALTHAIEAYLSTDHSDLTDAYAIKAMSLISKSLINAYSNGTDEEAREDMAKAQFMAGVAFSNASLGYVHAIAHQLGGLYNLPHGICNAVLLPFILNALGEKLEGNQFGEIGKALGLSVYQTKNRYTYRRITQHIESMNKQLNIPLSLDVLGVKSEDIEQIAEMALEDACRLTSPIQFSKEEIMNILHKGMKERRR